MDLFKTELTRCANVAGVNNPSNQEIYEAQQGCCFECHRPIGFHSGSDEAKDGYTVEHVFPVGMGFGLFGNKVLSCLDCNRKKANKLPNYQYVGAVRALYLRMLPRPAIDTLRKMRHPVWAGRAVDGAARHAH